MDSEKSSEWPENLAWFTHKGTNFNLDPDLIRSKCANERPEQVQKHWVEIGDLKWPVNQVMRIAIGPGQREMRSSAARRYFKRAGYTLGSVSDSEQTPNQRRKSVPFDESTLIELDEVAASVSFAWMYAGSIVLNDKNVPIFPPLPSEPGIYRFDLGVDAVGTRTIYIGESKNLLKRAQQYRDAKADGRRPNRTARRMHKKLIEYLATAGTIDFAIACVVNVDGAEAALSLKSTRLLAESAAVLQGQMDSRTFVLNIDAALSLRIDDRLP